MKKRFLVLSYTVPNIVFREDGTGDYFIKLSFDKLDLIRL